ncbi:hypothetical protein D3C78_1196100 [compost metagenome]
MSRDEVEPDPGDLPEESGPDEDPIEPAQDQKLDEGVAHPEEPEAGQGQGHIPLMYGGVPGRGLQDEGVNPDEVPHREDKQNEPDLRGDRIAPAHGALNGVVKTRQGEGRDQPPLDELADDQPDPLMDNQFGVDQQRDADQEADMGLYIQQKGHSDPLQQRAFPAAQQQQGQPAEPAQDQDPSPDMGIDVAEMSPVPQLIEGTAQDQGKVVRIGQGLAMGIGRGDGPVVRHDETTLMCNVAGTWSPHRR